MTPDPYADHEIPLPRLRTISQLWTLAAVLGAVGVAALAIDVPVASWVRTHELPSFFRKLCGLAEVFAHGVGIAALVAVIAVLDPWHRYGIPRILAASLGAGLAANVFKLFVARLRPSHCDFDVMDRGIHTFYDWLPLATNPSWQQGFPSSHAAVAAGLAIVLACFYPRGRWLFPAIATLACCQRVMDQAHFVSDTFWGAAVGCIFAPLCIYGSGLSEAFDRLEVRLLARQRLARARRFRQRPAAPAPLGAQTIA
jgi:membrane-associated phospholipid phosphatase